MIPAGVHDLLKADPDLIALGITSTRIKELQSCDQRPFESGYFVVINFEDFDITGGVDRGPQDMTVHVHTPLERERNYRTILRIQERIRVILTGVEQYVGSDGVRITQIKRTGQSGNLMDDGWKTITRNTVYSVLFDVSAA